MYDSVVAGVALDQFDQFDLMGDFAAFVEAPVAAPTDQQTPAGDEADFLDLTAGSRTPATANAAESLPVSMSSRIAGGLRRRALASSGM